VACPALASFTTTGSVLLSPYLTVVAKRAGCPRLVAFFVVGGLLLTRVDVRRGRQDAGNYAAELV
jgi:hypothetical protein